MYYNPFSRFVSRYRFHGTIARAYKRFGVIHDPDDGRDKIMARLFRVYHY